MELAWQKWKRRPIVDQTWNHWKTHWTAAFTELRGINRMTAGDRTFAHQAATGNQEAQMVVSLDNLANAAIQKNYTVDKLIAAKERLAKALAYANSALVRLRLPNTATTTTTATTAPASSAARPAHWASTPPDCDPNGHCWTHGFKVKTNHNSANCAHRADGHISTAMGSDIN
jgi:hypothetical protein